MMTAFPGPTSRFYVSQRLRLHYVDWGNHAAPPLVLVHGGRDHCPLEDGRAGYFANARVVNVEKAGHWVHHDQLGVFTLLDCERCVRAAGGSDVALLAGPGGIDCDAVEDGIRAEGNAVVRLDALGGDVVITAGEAGVRSAGTARIELAGDLCRVEGGEGAIRTNGGGEVVTGECTALDLFGGVDDGDDGDEGEDDDHGDDDQGEDD